MKSAPVDMSYKTYTTDNKILLKNNIIEYSYNK